MAATLPACPAEFEPIAATLYRTLAGLPPIAVEVCGVAVVRSWDLERGEHYRRAMAVLSTGTLVGLRRVRFEVR